MTKKCPFCAEDIHIDAIKCKHCGSMLADIKSKDKKEKHKITEINKFRILLSIILLFSFFIPWLNFPLEYSINGYRLPILLEKGYIFGNPFSEDAKYLLLGYIVYLIPLCSIYNILNRLANISRYNLLDEFLIGSIVSLTIFYALSYIHEDALEFIALGLYITLIVSLAGTVFNLVSTIVELLPKGKLKNNSNAVLHLEQKSKQEQESDIKNHKEKVKLGRMVLLFSLSIILLVIIVQYIVAEIKESNKKAESYYYSETNNFTDDDKQGKNITEEIEIKNISVSSEMKSANVSGIHFTFSAENAVDDNLKTWWSPQTTDRNSSWIKISFHKKEKVNSLKIHGGSHYPDFPDYDLYEYNYRLKKGRITFSDNSTYVFELKDVDKIQIIDFPEKTTEYIIIEPLAFYETKQYKDFCISEMKVYRKTHK